MLRPKDLVRATDDKLITKGAENTIDHWLILHSPKPWPVYIHGPVHLWRQRHGDIFVTDLCERYRKKGWHVTEWSCVGLHFSPADMKLKHSGEKA